MFVFHPDTYLVPDYKISPFRTCDIGLNHNLPEDNYIDKYFMQRLRGKNYHYTQNGREAINLALSHYNLKKSDTVTILTTTGNSYISRCITNEIEKFCKWSLKINEKTKVLLVNHEFGYPYTDLMNLKKIGLPIIEDLAHSFFSKEKDNVIGKVGDFSIYSFPKMFPLQIGGLLVSNLKYENIESRFLDNPGKRYIKNVLSYYIKRKDKIIEKRIRNYTFLSQKFKQIGFLERFELADDIVPGVFMFHKGKNQLDLSKLKNHCYAHGIQCSVFYGEESFYIPVHQNLNEEDLTYFLEVINQFIKHRS